MEESIYNIIPKEYAPQAKGPLYKSKYPPNIIPTGTTFCHKTTSKPLVYLPLFRPRIWEESSQRVCKPILSSEQVKPLGI